ncbi:MAG TPA: asparagine synthase [Bacillus sp. (in: firmicutes)]|uniref:asparagine synthase n=1 Tax=Bacillus litorisediminis TaxID=2922713 RepID=UPI001FB00D34|nr:asparagine synthase [Bacillus litorisediminis]HWO77192.1 asparagine synthase [Bacillus sp. (in: firmicutes)]
MYRIREGLIPTILGCIFTICGILLTQNRRVDRMVSNTILGFGLGHIVLGVIDLFEHRYHY